MNEICIFSIHNFCCNDGAERGARNALRPIFFGVDSGFSDVSGTTREQNKIYYI